MPCFSPNVVKLDKRPFAYNPETGEVCSRKPLFVPGARQRWKKNPSSKIPKNLDFIACKQCIGCRIAYSREWATRCVHEASLYDENCFLTLTYNNESLPEYGSLDEREVQLFFKKLRNHFPDQKIRYFYCGEYGPKLGRPHYHLIVFNFYPSDVKYWKTVNGFRYYKSPKVAELWGKGFVVVGDVTYESAAYVARYVLKKITGKAKEAHYTRFTSEGEEYQLKPEYSTPSRGREDTRGIGYGWYKKFKSDLYPSDQCVIRNKDGTSFVGRPPKYYDRMLEREDPEMFERVKAKRLQYQENQRPYRLFKYLQAQELVQKQRLTRLVRAMEAQA